MEERNLDHVALAMLANVNPRTVKRWMDGINQPRFKNLPGLTDALDVSGDYLLGRA
ncbi:helix-turn-helix domain-containing protein [Paenibacillus sp. 22594]|uniref:helix-turn-helix domain-containing protein n=1 Tax=Paenibacillus sp. 22594 TaxID=3453947 RepID=UPI003F86B872